MSIYEICIRRPVFTWVLTLIPVVLGLFSFKSLGVDLFPNVDFPVASVVTVLKGASVEEMESSVTKPIEDVVNTISGIDELRSNTYEGVSVVTVQFNLSKNGDVGTQEVRDKIASLLPQLPDGIESPVIQKFDTDSMPVMTLAVFGRRDLREVTEIARTQLKERLETIDGVGSITLVGGRKRAMNIFVDPNKLTGYGLTVEDVRAAIQRQNVEVPGGRVNQGSRELVLRTLGRLDRAVEFEEVVIANRGGRLVRVKDVGRVEDSNEEPRTFARLDRVGSGEPARNAVSLVIQKQSGTNAVKVVDDVKERLRELAPTLPPDIDVEIIKDQSRFIKKSIEEVQFHLWLAALLVAATVMLFIRDWRTTLIAALAIPTSIVPTFAFMSYMGYTLNNITMLGLILAVGIVIDDAVVVNENIFRKMEEEGLDGMEAALKGTREISLAVLATSLSLIIIFVPIAFMGGIVGRFFNSFGLTVAFAVAMSMFVSFTLTPMLCSRMLKRPEGGVHKTKDGPLYRFVDNAFGGLLRFSLRFKFIIVILTVATIVSTAPIWMMTGFSLIPRDDQSEFEVVIQAPEGYTLDRTRELTLEIERRLKELRGVRFVFTTIGSTGAVSASDNEGDVTTASIYVRMVELHERDFKQFDVQNEARAIMEDYPDLRVSVNDVSAFQGGRRSQTFQVNLAGPELEKLADYSASLLERLKAMGGLTDLDTTLALRKPELRVRIDRDRAGDLDIPVSTIADTMRVLVGGMPISKFREGNEQYDVWLRAELDARTRAEDLIQYTLPSPKGGLVKLGSLASLEEARGPVEIERLNRQRIVTVLGNPDSIPLGEAVNRANLILDSMNLPPDYSLILTGQAKTMTETLYYFVFAFLLSVTFMYLVLAAQFESWTHPFAILMALPVTLPFGLLSVLLFRYLDGVTTMDLYGMFGLFMLIGIVKKNGILQVDATNQNRARGMAREEAILRANKDRLRPILMTTMMLVAAMIPIALGQGPGSGARASMAKVIIGGQMFSLVLALLVTPVFYVLIEQTMNLSGRIFRRRPPAKPGAPRGRPRAEDDGSPDAAARKETPEPAGVG